MTQKPNMNLQNLANAKLRMKWYDMLPPNLREQITLDGDKVNLPKNLQFTTWLAKMNKTQIGV